MIPPQASSSTTTVTALRAKESSGFMRRIIKITRALKTASAAHFIKSSIYNPNSVLIM